MRAGTTGLFRTVLAVLALSVPPVAAGPVGGPEMLPNLVPLPPYDVHVAVGDHPEGALPVVAPGHPPPTVLRFTTSIQNRGAHSLELLAGPAPASPSGTAFPAALRQCVRFAVWAQGAPRVCLDYRELGAAQYHPAHHHAHVPGIAVHDLRRDVNGRIDMSPAGLVRQASRRALCLSDMHNWRKDPALDNPDARAQTVADTLAPAESRGWYRECGTVGLQSPMVLRQGISPGWLDSSPPWMTGQQIPLRGVPDGLYWIVLTVNGGGAKPRLLETDYQDNVVASRIQIYGGGRKARLLWPQPPDPQRYWYDNPEDQPGE